MLVVVMIAEDNKTAGAKGHYYKQIINNKLKFKIDVQISEER